MGERWIKEAEDLRARGSSGTMSRNHNNPKVTWHVTVSPPGSFDSVHRVLTSKRSEPHFIYDPKTDRLGQYFACDRGARALANDGATPTNRDGTINIQIEVCAWPGDIHSGQKGFTEIPEFDPNAPNWRALMRCIRSWGIPDHWPSGNVMRGSWASDSVSRSWSTYRKSGHFGHCHVPGNSHWDPGNIDMQAIFGKGGGSNAGSSAPASSKPKTEKYYDPPVKRSVKSIQRIVGVKADSYYGEDTKAAVKRYQRKIGATPVDGYWGSRTERAHKAYVAKGKPSKGGDKLVVDGIEGKATVRALQRFLGVKVDGIRGRNTNKAMQKWLGVAQDGIVGRKTIAALQRKVGANVDSIWGRNTTKALQRFLNRH